jgi:hypothetical protein
MGDQEGITWERLDDDKALVVCRKVVPLQRVDALVRDLHSVCRGEWVERPAPQQPLPPAQALKPSRSFGRLPPGVYPYWQRREWVVFALWSIAVVVILAAAIRRNVAYFF